MGRRVRHFNPGHIDAVNYALDSRFVPQQGYDTTVASITARKGPTASQSTDSRRATYFPRVGAAPAFDCGTGTSTGVKLYNLSGTVQVNPTFTAINCLILKDNADPAYTHMMGRQAAAAGANPQPCNFSTDGPSGATRVRTYTDTTPFTPALPAWLNNSASLSRGFPVVYSTSSTAYSTAATSMFVNGVSSTIVRNSSGGTETGAAWPSSFYYDAIIGILYEGTYYGSNCYLYALCTAVPALSIANHRRIEQHYAYSFVVRYG